MNDGQLQRVEQVKKFLEGSKTLEFRGLSAEEKYKWTETVLVRFSYLRLKKAEKGVIRQYIQKITGYSRAQVSRLIAEYKRIGWLKKTEYRRHRFPRKYTPSEVQLLARTEELHGWLSGPATKKIMERECEVHGHSEFSNTSRISIAPIVLNRLSREDGSRPPCEAEML